MRLAVWSLWSCCCCPCGQEDEDTGCVDGIVTQAGDQLVTQAGDCIIWQ